MIAALCAHPCLDKSASLDRFSPEDQTGLETFAAILEREVFR